MWEMNGEKAGENRAAFEAQITNDMNAGRAETTIEQFVEQDNVIVALNRGRFIPHTGGDGMHFVSAEVYTFTDSNIQSHPDLPGHAQLTIGSRDGSLRSVSVGLLGGGGSASRER